MNSRKSLPTRVPSCAARVASVMLLAALLLPSWGCSSSTPHAPATTTNPPDAGVPAADGPRAIVVGLMSDDMPVFLDHLHVQTTIDGAVATDELLQSLEHGQGWGPAPFWPKEIQLVPNAGSPDGEVGVEIEGYMNPGMWPESNFPGVDLWPGLSPSDPNFATKRVLVRRLARQHFVPGKNLLRITIQNECARVVFGPFLEGPVCDAVTTCISGQCVAPDTDKLEPYWSDWAAPGTDVCMAPGGDPAAPPAITLGSGETMFTPLADGATLQTYRGPQGGHHIWIAVRMTGLDRYGSAITITGQQPGGGLSVPATAYTMAFDPDPAGCALVGVRVQLDASQPLGGFLGKPLDVKVEVKDRRGLGATAVAHVTVDTQVVCPMPGPCP